MTDVRLPPALAAAIADLARPLDLGAAAARLSAGYRANRPSRQSVPDAAGAAAYAASRMPATFAAATAALARLDAARPDFRPVSVIDLGAGPGTASWAAAAIWPSLTAVTMVEASADFRALSRHLATFGPPVIADADIRAGDLADPPSLPAGPFDLAVVGYALTELDGAAATRLALALIERAGRLVLIEPGTPRDHARLMAVRQALLGAGGRILAPCPHGQACLLAGDDWCHTSVRLPRSRTHMRLKAGTVPFEDERYSYLVVESPSMPPVHDERRSRILRPPLRGKHEQVLALCRPDGSLGESRVPSRDRPAFKAAGKLDWGDSVADPVTS